MSNHIKSTRSISISWAPAMCQALGRHQQSRRTGLSGWAVLKGNLSVQPQIYIVDVISDLGYKKLAPSFLL